MLSDRPLTDIARVAALVAIATIPFEISKLFLPPLGTANLVDGRVASSLDLARLALLVAVGAFSAARGRDLGLRPSHGVSACAAGLAALGALSLLWSLNPTATLVESIRLIFLVAGFGALASIAATERVLSSYVTVLTATMTIMAIAAVLQRVSGVYLWNLPLAPTGRVNVTYADPNILARHLIVGISLTIAIAARRGQMPVLGVLVIGLLATGSRSGLVTVVILLGYLAVRGRGAGARRSLHALVLGGSFVVLLVLADAGVRERLGSLTRGNSLGPRPFLLRAGWNMFLDHPLGGVGLGAFPSVYRGEYPDFFSYYGASGVASHTSAVTILAELGVAGVLVVSALLVLAFLRPPAMRDHPTLAAMRLGFEGALLTLILMSQSEGRLIEDPMLWVVLAGIVAADRLAVASSAHDLRAKLVRSPRVEAAPLLVPDVGGIEPPR